MKRIGNYFLKKTRFLIILSAFLPVVILFQNCGQNSFQGRAPTSVNLLSENLNSESEIIGNEELMDEFSREASDLQNETSESNLVSLATTSRKTYYVSKSGNDTTGLSKTTAFKTIQKAAKIAKAGDTVMVLAGIYKETIFNTNSGTSSARIRFVSSPRWAAKIAPVKGASAFWTSDGAYVDIEGFTFDGKLGGEIPLFRARAIQSNGNASRIMYNNIRLYRACTTALFYRSGVGIGIGGYESNYNTEVFGNILRNTRVVGCSLPPRIDKDSNGTYHYDQTAGYGMYLSTPKTKAYNNIIYGFRIGIHLWHNPTENIISHNLIFNNGNTRQGYQGNGIVFGCGDKPYKTCKNIVVTNNIIISNQTLFAIRETGRNVAGSNSVLNNILYKNTSNAIVTGPSDAIVPMVRVVSGNKIIDPKFVNFQLSGSGDYRLAAGSPAINKASPIGAVTKDINQGVRPASKDIGPYEYGVVGPSPVNVSATNAFLVK